MVAQVKVNRASAVGLTRRDLRGYWLCCSLHTVYVQHGWQQLSSLLSVGASLSLPWRQQHDACEFWLPSGLQLDACGSSPPS